MQLIDRAILERLAQCIARNPFAVEKMQVNRLGGMIVYRSGMSEKIHRNFEVFSPYDFIADIIQRIPDKSFQLVRYYGWHSNKMGGQRDKRAAEAAQGEAGKPILLRYNPDTRDLWAAGVCLFKCRR